MSASRIEVWHVALDECDGARAGCILSAAELGRANRMRSVKKRLHFMAARAALRSILARYLDIKPFEVRFSYGPYGKPALAPDSGSAPVHFNLSHAGGYAVIAVSASGDVGVDIEMIRADVAVDEIARRIFSQPELDVFDALPPEVRAAALYRSWASKEAYVKARGDGMCTPLDGFVVEVDPRRAPRLLIPIACDRCTWFLHEVRVGDGYAAVLATEEERAPIVPRFASDPLLT